MVKIEVIIDESCSDPKVIVMTDKVTEDVNDIIRRLSDRPSQLFVGFQGNQAVILEPNTIIRFYTASQKVFVVAESGEYTVRLRLYEIEEQLRSRGFVRISSSEIINLKKVKGFDLGLSGTICVRFQNGTDTYVSRRYVAKIRQVLGM